MTKFEPLAVENMLGKKSEYSFELGRSPLSSAPA